MKHMHWIDAYKGVLILLVVAGHAIGGGLHLLPVESVSRTIAEGVFKFIYLFHMPAFFFIAGVTLGNGSRKTMKQFLTRKLQRLIVPYLVFGIISAVLYLAMSGSFNSIVGTHSTDAYYSNKSGVAWWVPFVGLLHGGGMPRGMGFIANSVLWFLPCLFTVEVAYFSLDRLVRTRGWQLAIGAILFLAAYPLRQFLPLALPWGLHKLPYYLPFVIMGRWLPETWSATVENRFSWTAIFTGTVLLAMLACGTFLTPNANLANAAWDWSILFSGLAVVGTWGLFAVIRLLDWQWLRVCGSASLTIMLLHKFLVIAFQLKIPFCRALTSSGGWAMTGITVVIVVLSVVVCLVADRMIVRFSPWMLGKRRGRPHSHKEMPLNSDGEDWQKGCDIIQ